MNEILRTFISISVPRQVLKIRDMLITTVDDPKGRIRWVRKGRIHLTLRFIGPTPADAIPEINNLIEKTVKGYALPDIMISRTGCFPDPRRPRVLWLGLDGNLEPLKMLVSELNDQLESAGYLKDEQEYVPHITLGRVKYPPKTAPGINTFLNTAYEPVKMRCTRIQYMSSVLQPNGAVYSILGIHDLQKKD